ncbi:hypothetical protein FB45DRAFT_1102249 [Roridomyces roridus]|uniref:Uncharacterized protein n=1 Tax=Roridomyces roridus TaxID=1738132 RepID=A0AAD7CGS2_9AGAR|nr:hypothetical protein FB45DRAFT_1102249 [Roridomyces roridus]
MSPTVMVRKSKLKEGLLTVDVGPPFLVSLESPEVETPSPLTLSFDIPSPISDDSTAEYPENDESDNDDIDGDAQFISISPGSPFYTPRQGPIFHVTFGVVFPKPPLSLPSLHTTTSHDSEPETDCDSDGVQCISIAAGSEFHQPPSPPSFSAAFVLPPVHCFPLACGILAGMIVRQNRRCRSSTSPALSRFGAAGRRPSLNSTIPSLHRIGCYGPHENAPPSPLGRFEATVR